MKMEDQPPPPTVFPPPPTAGQRKRPLDVKIEDIMKFNKRLNLFNTVIRPHILEVLANPNFRNCNAAEKIRQELNAISKLLKDTAPLTSGISQSQLRDIKQEVDLKPFPSGNVLRTENGEHGTPGSYMIGGSAFGWNFITFSGNDAFYYGRTKESFRKAQQTQQGS